MSRDWSDIENAATIADYLSMLDSELRSLPYNKSEHRRQLAKLLDSRTERAIDSKHQNISAVLLQLGMRWIAGYKPLVNYQRSLREAVEKALLAQPQLISLAEADLASPVSEQLPMNILEALTQPPQPAVKDKGRGSVWHPPTGPINIFQREEQFRALGLAGERFVLKYEHARLSSLGRDDLASRIEHISLQGRDYEGFDIRSFDATGRDRLIEVKTTRYPPETPFYLSRNELRVSETRSDHYHLYRVYDFKTTPRLFIIQGNLRSSCNLEPTTYAATVA